MTTRERSGRADAPIVTSRWNAGVSRARGDSQARAQQTGPRARWCLRLALSASCCWLVPLAAAGQEPADAVDPTVHARESFEAGVAQYEAGHFAEALADFQEAYRVKPHPLVRVNIANCYDKLGRPAEALENFQAFLDAAEGAPTQRDEVRSAVAELEQRVGRLELDVAPEGAQITIDEDSALRAPLGQPVVLASGQHRLAIALTGYETAVRIVEVKARESVALRIQLSPLPAASASAESGAPPRAAEAAVEPLPPAAVGRGRPHVDYENVWIAGSVTFALAITSVVTGQLALAANREFDSNLNAVRNPMLNEFQRAGAWARGVDSANRAEALAVTTDVLLGMTLVGAGLTTYFFLSSHPDAEAPQVSAGLGRVSFRAHF
jgi:hypothetical protein